MPLERVSFPSSQEPPDMSPGKYVIAEADVGFCVILLQVIVRNSDSRMR